MDDTRPDTTPAEQSPSSHRVRVGRFGLAAGGVLAGLGLFAAGLALGSGPAPTRSVAEAAGLVTTTTDRPSTTLIEPGSSPTTSMTSTGSPTPPSVSPSGSHPSDTSHQAVPHLPPAATTIPSTPTTTPTPPTPTPTTTPSVPPVEIVGPEEPEPSGPSLTIVTVPAGILSPKLQFPGELAFGAQFVATIHISNPGILPVSWTPGPGSTGVSWSTSGGTIEPGTGMTVQILVPPTNGPWTAQASLRYAGKDHPIALSGFHLGPNPDQGIKFPMP